MIFEREGLKCDVASDSHKALWLLKQRRYSVLTLDVGLPGRDGVWLLRELRRNEETARVPIVVVSASADDGRSRLGVEGVEVVDWLEKPIDRERLVTSVKRAIERSRRRGPRILHVESDADVCRVVSRMLENAAWVSSAGTLRAAYEALSKEPYDLVILDAFLPDGPGRDLLTHLSQGPGPAPPALFFSSNDVEPESASQAAATFVKSRTTNCELVAAVESLLSRKGTRIPSLPEPPEVRRTAPS